MIARAMGARLQAAAVEEAAYSGALFAFSYWDIDLCGRLRKRETIQKSVEMKMRALCLLLAIGVGFVLRAEETSQNSQRLKDALKRFPQSDANGDGVLTLEEATAFKKKAEAPDGKEDDKDKTVSKHIYKTVGGEPLALYVWKPEGHKADTKVPAIVLFHGGGFKSGNYAQFREQAKYFASRGMVAMSVNYRLIKDPGVEVEDCIEDAKSAMRWVRNNAAKLGVDPDRIASGGGSAGGYLAVAALLIEDINAKTDQAGVSSKPNAMVLFNPGFGGREKEEGPDPRDPEGKGDLKKYVKPNQPPMINFFGTEDPLLANARRFQETYRKAGNRCELLTYEGENHSFFNKDKYRELTLTEADKFLVELGWLTKKDAQQ